MKLCTKKIIVTFINSYTKDPTQGHINLPNRFLIKHEIEVLKLGLSFTPAPKHNISELETDIYNFIRKLCLTYHFRDSPYEDKLIVKNASTFTSNINENQELESISKNLSESEINVKTTSDNIPNLRDWLDSLITKIRSNKIIIKPADKGSIVVVMMPKYYWAMCQSHLKFVSAIFIKFLFTKW